MRVSGSGWRLTGRTVSVTRMLSTRGGRVEQSGYIFRVGIILDFVRRTGTTRTMHPHGACVWGAERSRIDPLGWY